MNSPQPSYEELEAQLAQAQAIIKAIQAGEIDAILHQNCNEIALIRPEKSIRATETALQQSETRYQQIVEIAQEGIWVVDANFKTIFVNQRMSELLGYSEAEMLGSCFYEFIDDSDRAQAEQAIQQSQQGIKTQGDLCLRRQDNSKVCAIMSTNPLLDEQGQYSGTLSMFTDITERRQIEKQLRNNEAKMVEAQRLAHFGNWELDLQTEAITWSEETFRLFGFDPKQPEPSYEQLLAVIHPEDVDKFTKNYEQISTTSKLYEFEYRIILPDGSIRYIYEWGTPKPDQQGQIIKIFGTALDITERKQAELEREQALTDLTAERASLAQRVIERTAELTIANSELERAVRLKDEFLANMSHELRTPLNAILGQAEILQEYLFGNLSPKQTQSIQTIESSARHLLSLINDILDVAKIEAGQLEIKIEPCSAEEICYASLDFIKQSAIKKKLTLVTNFDSTVTMIQADQRRLKQILVNLLSNAMKFTPSGGKIGLDLVGNQLEQQVDFIVWDTGIGIPPEKQALLFQPFVQLDSKLSREYEGTGLGLALVQRLTQLHGGQVTLVSEVNKGSRITITLPWQELDSYQKPEKVAEDIQINYTVKPTGQSPLILVVDDNKDSVMTISDFLQFKGYQVMSAYNGIEAIEQARKKLPELILMDIQMPHLDGLETIQQFRADSQLAHIPIIAITALARPEDKKRCLEAGANNYLSKPLNLKQLMSTIESQRAHSNRSLLNQES
jgi:PAS domain S-box-containing protein